MNENLPLNGASNPARATIVLYRTGQGHLTPGSVGRRRASRAAWFKPSL